MKVKKEAADWNVAVTHYLTSGFAIPCVMAVIMAPLIMVLTKVLVLRSILIFISDFIGLWLGIISSVKYLAKTYIVKSPEKVLFLSTVYFLVLNFIMFVIIWCKKTGAAEEANIIVYLFVFALKGTFFYIVSKKYIGAYLISSQESYRVSTVAAPSPAPSQCQKVPQAVSDKKPFLSNTLFFALCSVIIILIFVVSGTPAYMSAFLKEAAFSGKLPPINKTLGRYYYDLSGSLADSKKYNEAIAAGEKAIQYNPDLDGAYGCIGAAYLHKGEHEKALPFLEKAYALNPRREANKINLDNAYSNLFSLSLNKNKYAETVYLMEKYTQVYPDDSIVWGKLGMAYMFLGRVDKAKEAIKKSLVINPNEIALINLAKLIQKMETSGLSGPEIARLFRAEKEKFLN